MENEIVLIPIFIQKTEVIWFMGDSNDPQMKEINTIDSDNLQGINSPRRKN